MRRLIGALAAPLPAPLRPLLRPASARSAAAPAPQNPASVAAPPGPGRAARFLALSALLLGVLVAGI